MFIFTVYSLDIWAHVLSLLQNSELDKNGRMIIAVNVIPDPTVPVRTLTTRTELGCFEPGGSGILTVIDCLS